MLGIEDFDGIGCELLPGVGFRVGGLGSLPVAEAIGGYYAIALRQKVVVDQAGPELG